MGFLAAAIPLITAAGSMFAGGATATGLSAVATAASVGSAALGAAGSLMEGASSSQASMYRSAVASANARMAESQGINSLVAGAGEESRLRGKTGKLVAEQLATQAAGGVDTGVGTASLVRDVTEAEGELDALTLRYNASKQAHAFKMEAFNQDQQSLLEKRAAKTARMKSYLGAASSIIGGIGGIAKTGMAAG